MAVEAGRSKGRCPGVRSEVARERWRLPFAVAPVFVRLSANYAEVNPTPLKLSFDRALGVAQDKRRTSPTSSEATLRSRQSVTRDPPPHKASAVAAGLAPPPKLRRTPVCAP
jgi:hypothetical protein